ncbi:type VI secretion system lipoprotein TssJ [Methylobacterium persicinum]
MSDSVPLRRMSRRDLMLGFASATALAGCSSAPDMPTTPLNVTINADEQINPNESGIPSPIVLRIYELKSPTAFEQASFFDLLDHDTTKLGTDLVAKREFEMKPGEKGAYTRDAPAEVRHVGIIAGFRQIDVAQWRAVVAIKPESDNALLISVTALAAKIERQRDRRTFGLF